MQRGLGGHGTLADGERIVDSIVVHLVHFVNLVYSSLGTPDADSSAWRCLLCCDIEQVGDLEGCAVGIWRR
jgi:hypothetical protein